MTEPISLAETTYLRFWHWMEAEVSQAYPGYAYDGGLVEMSVNGGRWEQIFPEGGYPYKVREGDTPGPFPAETELYSGTFDWTEALFVITGHTGTAQFRFRFGSDGAETREGWYVDDVEVSGHGAGAQGGDEDWKPVALHPELMQNSPNPFAAGTVISFQLPRAGQADVSIFDATGRLVRTLFHGEASSGLTRLTWDGCDERGRPVPAGVYYYRLTGEGLERTRSLTLLR